MPEAPPNFAAVIVEKHARMRALADEAIAASPTLARLFGDDDVDQLVRAFESVLVEAIEGSTSEIRQLVITSAIPAAIAGGATVTDLVQANVTFAVLLTEIVSDLPDPERRDARLWLADFMGSYVRDAVDEAMRGAT